MARQEAGETATAIVDWVDSLYAEAKKKAAEEAKKKGGVLG
jgi:hypothetical protein